MKKILRIIGYGILFTAIVILDRLTKWWALNTAQCELFPCVSVDIVINRGIAWGFFHQAPHFVFWLLVFINSLIILGVAWHAIYCWLHNRIILGHILILAGAIANMIDRFMYRGVIDFILLSYKNYSFPVFNVADIAIVVGVGVLFLTNYGE